MNSDKKSKAMWAHSFLASAGVAKKVRQFEKAETIFSQGAHSDSVLYIQDGAVKITAVNESGNEAILTVLGSGAFFGEGCLAGQPLCRGTATAMIQSTVLVIAKNEMQKLLHEYHDFCDLFINFVVTQTSRIEEDLLDLLFNSTEKRLARLLLLLARYGKREHPQSVVPNVSQETLAEMIGTTRTRVNLFMNKFKKLGFIKYNGGGLQVNNSLLSVILHD